MLLFWITFLAGWFALPPSPGTRAPVSPAWLHNKDSWLKKCTWLRHGRTECRGTTGEATKIKNSVTSHCLQESTAGSNSVWHTSIVSSTQKMVLSERHDHVLSILASDTGGPC
jgi:hypothetical protein